MKSTSEVKLRPRSVKKYIRREKARIRKVYDGEELEQAIIQLMQKFKQTKL